MSTDPNAAYYDAGGIETIEIIRAKLTPEQFRGYILGNTIKYACRLNHKGAAERDAEKIAHYAHWLIDGEKSSPHAPGPEPKRESNAP